MKRIKQIIKSFWLVPVLFFSFLMLNDGYHSFTRGKDTDWAHEILNNVSYSIGFAILVFLVIYFSTSHASNAKEK